MMLSFGKKQLIMKKHTQLFSTKHGFQWLYLRVVNPSAMSGFSKENSYQMAQVKSSRPNWLLRGAEKRTLTTLTLMPL